MAIEFTPTAATNVPTGGHLFSPLVATNFPTNRLSVSSTRTRWAFLHVMRVASCV
jgi:hypothetical protein